MVGLFLHQNFKLLFIDLVDITSEIPPKFLSSLSIDSKIVTLWLLHSINVVKGPRVCLS